MRKRIDRRVISRRRFSQYLVMLAIGGRTFFTSGDARAAITAAQDAGLSEADWPKMSYRKLGRTNFNASRLAFGCGATLMFFERDELLNAAFDAGVNVFDVGYRGYYRNAEENLAPFLQKVRDSIFLISKARVDLEAEPEDIISVGQARQAADSWMNRLDESLKEMKVEHVNAYYLMASDNPSLIESEEIYRAFQKAKQAGKVDFLGLSTHRNAENVLKSAAKTGRYDLAMIAVTPAGWYDWETKNVVKGARPLTELQPVLQQARDSGMGLIGMKAARHIAGLPFLGWFDKPHAFDQYYDEKLLNSPLSSIQRSYAHVLANGLDLVNADMQSLTHLQQNVVAATTSQSYFV